MEFKDFKLHPKLTHGMIHLGFFEPTEVQKQVIPAVLKGKDVLGLAQTGTGKTAAFALPILHKLRRGKRERIRVLIIVPTRELADQLHEIFSILGQPLPFRYMTAYGGRGKTAQIHQLKAGTEIVIACPGRLLDLMQTIRVDFRDLEMLIIDEADRMLDMGFLPEIKNIIKKLPGRRQNMLFSATMPLEIRKLADELLNNPKVVELNYSVPAKTVSHVLYPVASHLKRPLLEEILQMESESVLIFTNNKYKAQKLSEKLVKSGFSACSLHSKLSQKKRQENLDSFKSGRCKIMVATDIASRGLDIATITHVINYDMPENPEIYIHRIGRTGRAAQTGDAITLITDEDSKAVEKLEKVMGRDIERKFIENFDYQADQP